MRKSAKESVIDVSDNEKACTQFPMILHLLTLQQLFLVLVQIIQPFHLTLAPNSNIEIELSSSTISDPIASTLNELQLTYLCIA